MAKTYSAIKTISDQIKNATTAASNTAAIVGGNLGDIVDKIQEVDGAKVPKTTTVNGKPLSVDITLDATDIGIATDLADKVSKTATETIGGTKTFSESPIIPTPDADMEAATKKYVDDAKATVDAALLNKADLVGGKIPTSQLPAYVDDVLEYPNLAAFPAIGESGKIYVALDTNLTYRWSGTAYVEISKSLALGETSATAYRGDRGKVAYDHSQLTNSNPHGTTAAQIANTPAGTIAATTVQAAINELDADRVQLETNLNNLDNGFIRSMYSTAKVNELFEINDKAYGRSSLTYSKRIAADGNQYDATTAVSTDYIKVIPSSEIYVTLISTTANAGLAFYDSNKVFIPGSFVKRYITGPGSYSYEKLSVPSNAFYVRTTYYNLAYLANNIEFSLLAIGDLNQSNTVHQNKYALYTDNIPFTLSKLGDILFDNTGVLNIGLFGDSWTQGVTASGVDGLITYSKYLTRILQQKYGFAGYGWFDFSRSNSTNHKCADDEAVAFTFSGALTYKSKTPDCLGPAIAHTIMSVGSSYNLVFTTNKVDKAKIWYYNNANFSYSVNGGAAISVLADVVTGWQSTEIIGAIDSLSITALADNTVVFGVDLSYGTKGVKVHKLGNRGMTTAHMVAVNSSIWQQGIKALNLNFISILMFTNDRTGGVLPNNVVYNISTLVDRINSAYDNNIDVSIISPSETQSGTGTYSVSEYSKSISNYAEQKEVPYVSLKPVFGTPSQIIANGTFVDYLHPSKRGSYIIAEYLFKHLFEYYQYV